MRLKKSVLFAVLLLVHGFLFQSMHSWDPGHHYFARQLRAAPTDDPFNAFVEDIRAIARVVTGLKLAYEKLTGSVDDEQLVNEILLMGNIKPKDITDQFVNKIKAFLTYFEGISSQLDGGSEALKMENDTFQLKTIKEEFLKIADNLNISNAIEDYKRELAAAKAVVFNKTNIDGLKFVIGGLTRNLEGMRDFRSDLDPIYIDNDHGSIVSFMNAISTFQRVAQSFKTETAQVEMFVKLKRNVSIMKPLLDEKDLRKSCPTNPIVLTESNADTVLEKNLKKIGEVTSTYKNSQNILNSLHSLINARNDSLKQKFTLLPGFARGLEDWNTLFKREGTYVLKKFTKKVEVEETIYAFMMEFFDLIAKLKKAEAHLKSINEANALEEMRQVVAIGSKFVLNGYDQDQKSKLEDLQTCTDKLTRGTSFADTSSITLAQTAIKGLHDVLKNVTSIQNFQNSTELSALVPAVKFNSSDSQQQKTEVPAMVARLKGQDKPIVDNAYQYLRDLEAVLITLDAKMNSITAKITAVENALVHLDAYMASVFSSSHMQFYNCLQGTVDKVIQLISIISEFRSGSQKPQVSKIRTVVDVLKNSLGKLNMARSEVKKKENNYWLPPIQKSIQKYNFNPKVIGFAAQRLMRIQEVRMKRNTLKPLTEDVSNITTAATAFKTRLDRVDSRIHPTLMGISTIQTKLNQMFAAIDAIESNLKPNASKLAEYKAVFTLVGRVPDVLVNPTELKEAVQQLFEINGTSLREKNELINATDALSDLDLKFSSFVMTGIDSAFVSFDSLLVELDIQLGLMKHGPDDPKDDQELPWYIWVAILLGCAVLVAVVACFVYHCFIKQNNKDEKLPVPKPEDKEYPSEKDSKEMEDPAESDSKEKGGTAEKGNSKENPKEKKKNPKEKKGNSKEKKEKDNVAKPDEVGKKSVEKEEKLDTAIGPEPQKPKKNAKSKEQGKENLPIEEGKPSTQSERDQMLAQRDTITVSERPTRYDASDSIFDKPMKKNPAMKNGENVNEAPTQPLDPSKKTPAEKNGEKGNDASTQATQPLDPSKKTPAEKNGEKGNEAPKKPSEPSKKTPAEKNGEKGNDAPTQPTQPLEPSKKALGEKK